MWMRMVFKEILRRKWGFLFSALAIAIVVAALVLVVSITDSLKEEARRIGVKMGQNILIVPADVPLARYHFGEFGDQYLPERALEILTDASRTIVVDTSRPKDERIRLMTPAEAEGATKSGPGGRLYKYTLPDLADHYVGELQRRTEASANGRTAEVILTGQRQEEGRKKHNPITVPPKPGHAILGGEAAAALGLAPGGTVRVNGRDFTVEKVLPEEGMLDDTRLYVPLAEAQKMLDKPGQINRIVALGCLCEGLTIGQVADILADSLGQWRDGGLPLAKVRAMPMTRIATAREQMRGMMIQTARYLTPLLAIICAALVGGYLYFNVRERQQEIGVMLAIGFRPGWVLATLLVKLMGVGLTGFAAGFFGGIYLAERLGPSLQLHRVMAAWGLWPWALAGAVGLTLLAGLYPAVVAARTEAAAILRTG